MTSNGLQFKIQIDEALQLALKEMKNVADEQVLASGRRKIDIQSMLTARLTKLHREVGLDKVINIGSPFPNIYSPPSASDIRSVKLSFRITDMDIVKQIATISDKTGRPKPHVVYSLIRHIAEMSVSNALRTRISA